MALESLSDYTLTARYGYRNERGATLFEKWRYELRNPGTGERSKTFRYFDPATRSLRKPWGADAILYRLPEIREGVEAHETVHWVEGEKDADALAAVGLISTTHHQGAGHAHPIQASSVYDARRICLWVDKDKERPEVGAYDAWRRFVLLIDAGTDPGRILFRRAPGSFHNGIKDPADMLAAGYSIEDAVLVDRDKLRTVAERYTAHAGRRAGYRG